MSARFLIVNADDLGRSAGINEGILRAHEQGIVTSASLMVRGPSAEEAAQLVRRTASLSVGLHVDLGEWVFREGRWEAVYEVQRSIEEEIERQLAAFRRLLGREPTHLDSHQHAHLREPARSVVVAAADELAVPLRHFGPIRYLGAFYGQTDEGDPLQDAITPEALVALVHGLGSGWTELACHPAARIDFDSAYRGERLRELEALCDSRVRGAVAELGIELRPFAAAPSVADAAVTG
jgi:predicted glycoside hydrolase/deacetylase ChbG (UPF0249 family)